MASDHTTLETLMRCEQEAVFRHVRHLTSPEESLASFFGRVVHEGVRVLSAAWDVEAAVAACGAYWQREVTSGAVRLAAPSGGKPDHRTPQLAAALVRLYAAAWPPASRGYDVVMNERYLEGGRRAPGLPVSGGAARDARDTAPAPTEECGIVDRVVRRHADGLLYILDLKTSSWAPNAAYWRQWHNSQQAAIYLDLVEHALGEAPAGFWLHHLYVSGRRDGPKPEDVREYGPVTYSAQKRAELRQQRAAWREQFALLQAQPERALQSTRACFRMQSACAFLEYCQADPADRADMEARDLALGKLVVKPWEPGKRDV